MKQIFSLVLALALASGSLFSQSSSFESLNAQLSNLEGVERIYALHEIARLTASDSLELALTYLEESIGLAETIQEQQLQTEGVLLKGELYWHHHRTLADRQQAVNSYLSANRLAESFELPALQAQTAFLAGRGYAEFEEYQFALFHLFRSAIQFEAQEDSKNLMETYVVIADIFRKNQSVEQANRYSQMALKLADTIGADSLRAQIYYNLGSFNLTKGIHQSAWSFLNESLRLAEAHLPEEGQIPPLIKLAETQIEIGQPEDAKKNLDRAIQLARMHQQTRQLAEGYYTLAKWAHSQEAPQLAIAYLDTSSNLLKSLGQEYPIIRNYQLYIKQYMSLQDFGRVQYYSDLRQAKMDSLQVARNLDMITKMEILYETQQKDLRLKDKELDIAKKEARMKVVMMIGVLLLMLVIFLIWQFLNKQQANQVLEQQVDERTQALRMVNGELDTLAYRTAHDIRGPVARLLGLCQVALMEQGDEEEARELLELIQQEAFEMDIMLHRFLEVNNIKHQKEPDKYVRIHDLVDDLLSELDHLEGHSVIEFHKNIEPGLQVVTNETIFRILLKNVLENAIRFYQKAGEGPHYIRISGWLDAHGRMQLKVADNGIGIDPEVEPYIFNMFYRGTHASTGLGLGLYAANLAAKRLGASLTYEGTNPEETEFRIIL